ncbi:hypothetical protein C942_02221 [Photobacterium marinum]|uniref:Uncharacterized protein n=1 Tax=Photobacterium marinum TaxID=1056511 RepID=L8J724_9GAMM|nr:hypothetical protein [Photobacterium marinum]ELR64650.1 hypothetical protein C942_02221 [Photobacterium marinum]
MRLTYKIIKKNGNTNNDSKGFDFSVTAFEIYLIVQLLGEPIAIPEQLLTALQNMA